MNEIFSKLYKTLCDLYGEQDVKFNKVVNEIHIGGTIDRPSKAIMQADDDPNIVIGYHNDMVIDRILRESFRIGRRVGKAEFHYSCPRREI